MSWKEYFDIMIVNACKPKFFSKGTTLREVDEENNTLKFIELKGFEKGKIYSGGNLQQFCVFTNTEGGGNFLS